MRYKTIALILSLAVTAWAQTASSNPQTSAASSEKAKCACCNKTGNADAKEGQSCARSMAQSADGKAVASCCDSKKGKSCCGKGAKCMKGDKAGCCSDSQKEKTVSSSCCGSSCGKKCGKSCCGDKTEKASTNCCHKLLQS